MSLFSVMRFFHFLGLISLFGASFMMWRVGRSLRRAGTVEEVRVLLVLARGIVPFFPVGGVLLLVTGLHMAGTAWSFTVPWILVALLTLVTFLVLGPTVQRPAFMAMGKAAMTAQPGPLSAEVKNVVTNPRVWGLIYASTAGAFALLWIMIQKPAGWVGAAVPVLAIVALGAFLGVRAAQRDRAGRSS